MGLYEHINAIVYIVTEILQFNKVKLVAENNPEEVIEEIDIIRLRRIEN